MNSEQIELDRNRHIHDNMNPEQIELDRNRDIHENMNSEQIELDRNRNIHENMNLEQIELDRNRHIHENMNPEQIEQHQNRNIHENMNPEQIQQHNQRARNQRNQFKNMDQEWDYEFKCRHCNCLYLKSEKNRIYCCQNGQWLGKNSVFPYLELLPPAIKFCALDRIEHFGIIIYLVWLLQVLTMVVVMGTKL